MSAEVFLDFKMSGTSLVLLFALCLAVHSLTPSSYFTAVDQERLRNVFRAAKPYGEDLATLHYSVLGISLLSGGNEEPQKICDVLKKYTKTSDLESIYHSSSAVKALKQQKSPSDCQVSWSGAEKVLTDAINEQATSQQIYMAAVALTNIGKTLDATTVLKAVDAALEKDDSPLSHAYAFYTAALVGGKVVDKYHALIEDMVAQADEIDDVILRFEGGLFTTALLLDSAYTLSAAANKAPTISQEQVVKLVNYLLSRKHVQSIENAAVLLRAVRTLTDNAYHLPIAVTLASQVAVSPTYPIVQVRVCNLLGRSLGKVTVTADTARHLGDDAVVLSKKPFAASATDETLFELDFLKVKPARGFYKLSVSVAPVKEDKRLIGTAGAEVTVKVTTTVSIDAASIGVADREQAAPAKTTKLIYPGKASSELVADYHQKITLSFTLKDTLAGAPMTAHQVFVRMLSPKTQQEIIFVAEPDSESNYKFEMDVGSNANQFGYESDTYDMELIVGDAVIQNPFSWALCSVKLEFPEKEKRADEPDRYASKPEIKHQFREPEARPAAAVSTLFTALTLLPLLVLLALWARIGVNVANFPMSLSAIGFHLGLAGICGLYYCYFIQLNMFATLRYLAILGVPTFLFGNRLLSGIAARRK